MKTRRIAVITIITLIAVMLFISSVSAAEEKLVWQEGWPTKIHIGTGPIGGGFYMGGSCLANVLKEEWPHLEVIVEQTKASVHNARLTQAKEVHFAMCTTDTTYEAWVGQGPFEEYGKQDGMRIFMPSWANPMTFVTLKKSGVTNFKDFTGKVSGITLGSATDIFVRKVWDIFGIKGEVMNLATADSVQALKIGTIQGYSIGHPNTATQELALTDDIRILCINGEDADKFMAAHPEYTYPLTVPAGYYKGVDEDIDGVGFYDIMICRDDLPEEMVYTVLKAMYKHHDIIDSTWPLFADGMGPGFVQYMSSPMHEGSLRFYREVGAEIPEVAILENW